VFYTRETSFEFGRDTESARVGKEVAVLSFTYSIFYINKSL
jgi:hypothetical protein